MLRLINKKENSKLVLFIHGLTGDSETWKNSQNKHFGEMLADSDIVDEYDIAEYTYHTKIVDNNKVKTALRQIFNRNKDKAIKKSIDIGGVSEILQAELYVKFNHYKQIIIVAHSMGGLVAKSYILKCIEEETNHKVSLLLSLAVPHKGSNWALYGRSINNKQTYDLEPLSDFLDGIDDRWENSPENILPEVVCIYGKHDSVVLPKSASPKRLKNKARSLACDEDHTSISRPTDEEDIVFLFVKKTLEKNIQEMKLKKEMLLKELEDPSKYDDEDFVLKLIIADIHSTQIDDAKGLYYNADTVNRQYRDNDDDFAALKDIYFKIKISYRNKFDELRNGKIKNSSELLHEVYKMIKQEHEDTLSTNLPYITHYHKTGMVHHLANKAKYEIWWSLEHSQEDIDQLRK